ncbi:amidohydrolase [Terriglobus sp. 2YAB30_2]|uniref:amidohydrolase n=1 Tax=unclassified Terriglobus TaxID=2628988 RepID=UPI003F962E20
MKLKLSSLAILTFLAAGISPGQNSLTPEKTALAQHVDKNAKLAQVMVDTVFSYGELGFQEFETSKYLTGILEKNGFKVERGIASIPTAWMASWGSGKPVIALGSDIDCIPQASQKPGVAWHEPLIPGAPGHGEGHNSGVPLNILAALAVKEQMEKNHLSGTIKIWPGVAEELLGAKAYYVREGYFKDVDAVLFAHVGTNLGARWGEGGQTGLISLQYNFHGESAHAAAAPWRGKSALDAVELMDAGWNFHREHLRPQQRSHYVITNGGDQPNVVPQSAAVWYYFRELDYDHIKGLWSDGDRMAQGAALMTQTTWDETILGSAWPGHYNKPIAEDLNANATQIGLPVWSADDQALAKALQHEIGAPESGLDTELHTPRPPSPTASSESGPSDDIGDISWNVPTIVLSYPANIPNLPGHNWANAIAMATPIAHKGVVAGAKVQAMTLYDLMTKPELVAAAKDYFTNVQTKTVKYKSLVRPEDKPATFMNKATMEKYRAEMQKYYYDASKYPTYLDQLGVKYPTLTKPSGK